MIDFFDTFDEHLPPVLEEKLSDEQVIEEIWRLKSELKDQVVVLGHHYQSDEIIQFSDITGDSLVLAQKASKTDARNIIFCGVHFMAEVAQMLTAAYQTVILPDMNAGCTMADMANLKEVTTAWEFLNSSTDKKIVPITYINCAADLKGFVGEHGGSICTSSNARKIIEWAFNQGEKLLFFPDQHLGRNTCYEMGVPLEEMVIYDPNQPNGGLSADQVQKAKVILWYGYCSVHMGFTTGHALQIREKSPDTTIIVHPECQFDVVQAADLNGSTNFIVKAIEEAPKGAKFAVGTEINLVNRLAQKHPDKEIISLSPFQCICTTMYRVRPRWLLHAFQSIKNGNPINIIKVPDDITNNSIKALNKMLSIS